MPEPDITVVIPNRNGSTTLGSCLDAALASDHGNFEVVVVDDCSTDSSVEVIRRFPCRLVELPRHAGASAARNAGARQARGRILFFTDADCLLNRDTLRVARQALEAAGAKAVVGGTYTREPPEKSFFGTFQAVFINYFETKNRGNRDYVATHAMAIPRHSFLQEKGFPEDFLPILEDVEFSHRLKKSGWTLRIDPAVTVRHIFNYSLFGSLKNAWRKSRYWTVYSLRNGDILADSGTASRELKINVVLSFLCLGGIAFHVLGGALPAFALLALCACNLFFSRGLLKAFFRTGGTRFGLAAGAYYFSLYAVAVGMGALTGLLEGSRPWSRKEAEA